MTRKVSSGSLLDERVRVRTDIQWSEHNEAPSRWVARDPLTGDFFYFGEVEYAAIARFDGLLSLQSVLQDLRDCFPNYAISETWLLRLVQRLRLCNLVPNSDSLHTIGRAGKANLTSQPNHMSATMAILMSPLAVRIPMFNPSPLLRPFKFVSCTLWHPITMVIVFIVAALMALLVLSQCLRLGDAPLLQRQLWLGDRWLGLLLSFVVVKTLHELGHALACVRYQVQCREVGLYLLFFTPCFYCDTSDSWRLKSKWSRIAISAAGMYVELVIAAIAAAVWLLTRDGLIHSMAANTMIVCSVGTLAVNANPLLKYDGYYILSDLWGVPNLSEQSREALREWFLGWYSARPYDFSNLDGHPLALAIYAMAAFAYRLAICCTLLWIAWVTLAPIGLGLVVVLMLLGLALAISLNTWRAGRIVAGEWRAHGFRLFRSLLLLAILYYTVMFVVSYPIETYVTARGVTDAKDKLALFAPLTGEVITLPDSARGLKKGEVVFQLAAVDKELALCRVRGELELERTRVAQLRLGSNLGQTADYELPAALQRLAELEKKEQLLLTEQASLIQTAPMASKFIHAMERIPDVICWPADDRPDFHRLDPVNLGCTLQRGDLVGWLVPPGEYTITALVSQQDVKRLSLGMQADCYWDALMEEPVEGQIQRISPEPNLAVPPELVGDPLLISAPSLAGRYVTEIPHYEVTLSVATNRYRPLKGSLATVRIKADSKTLYEQIRSYVRAKFHNRPQS